MTIQTGDAIPEITLKRIREGVETVDTPSLFHDHNAVLFAVPGAFTPTCSERHLPGFVQHFDEFRKRGIDVYCISVNYPFVMQAWGKSRTYRKACRCWPMAMRISPVRSDWKWMPAVTAWACAPSAMRCTPKTVSSSSYG